MPRAASQGRPGGAARRPRTARSAPGRSRRAPAGWPPGRAGGEQVIELIQGLDAVVSGLGQERLANIAVEPFLLSPPFRLTGQSKIILWITGPGMDQADAQHRACPGQPRIGKRRAVVDVVPTSAQCGLCRAVDYAEPGED